MNDEIQLLDHNHCKEYDMPQNYTNKVLVLHESILKPEFKKPEYQLFLAESGFGCSPTASGRKVFGRFIADSENAFFYRGDFVGILDEQYLPEWAKAKLDEMTKAEPQTQGEGMKMKGMNL